MELKTIAAITISLSAAIMMPIQVAQSASTDQSKLAASRDAPQLKSSERASAQTYSKEVAKEVAGPSRKVLQEAGPQLQQIPRAPRVGDLEPVNKQFTPPVITDPASGYVCCAHRRGQDVAISSEFDISGEGLPGHLIRVRAELVNGDTRSTIKNERVRVDDDGHWRLRWLEVASDNMSTNSGFIEINATQYFPATRVRQDDDEAHAEPVFLRYRTPARPSMGAATTSGG